MSVILDAIKENLRHIRIIFEPTESSFSKDTKNTGDARELSVKEFLESYFPQSFQVKKGLIYSQDSSSQEIDCVLLAPNHPRLFTPVRDIIIAEGVHAAIEVKPDISTLTEKSEFFRALKQAESVKKLDREISILPTGFMPGDHRIPTIIFSYKSRKLSDITDYMINLFQKGIFQSQYFPDLIVTMDHGIIFHSACASKCMFRNFINSQIKLQSENIFLEIPDEENKIILALFLFLVYSFTPPEPFMTEPILKKYLSGISTLPIQLKQYI